MGTRGQMSKHTYTQASKQANLGVQGPHKANNVHRDGGNEGGHHGCCREARHAQRRHKDGTKGKEDVLDGDALDVGVLGVVNVEEGVHKGSSARCSRRGVGNVDGRRGGDAAAVHVHDCLGREHGVDVVALVPQCCVLSAHPAGNNLKCAILEGSVAGSTLRRELWRVRSFSTIPCRCRGAHLEQTGRHSSLHPGSRCCQC